MKQKVKEQINWYLSARHLFNFDGKISEEIEYDKNGKDGFNAFYVFDSNGKKEKTKHPNIFQALCKTKGSVNLHIKMYAEDRAKGVLPKMIFDEMITGLKIPNWFVNAVETQKGKYY
jgi:hypothetical protein